MNQVTSKRAMALGFVGIALACEPAAEPAAASGAPALSNDPASELTRTSSSGLDTASSTAGASISAPVVSTTLPPVVTATVATSFDGTSSSPSEDSVSNSFVSEGTSASSEAAARSSHTETTEPTGSVSTSGTTDALESGNESSSSDTLRSYASGFSELYLHDECTDDNPADDVCAHARSHGISFTFGGDSERTYAVTLRIRGLFEPTNIAGGTTPYPDAPFFKVGGSVTKTDYSQWQIRTHEPEATYYLNHYPSTGHIIYKEDFEATISVQGQSTVEVRVEDANDRQIDNGYVGLADRQQTIEGVTDGVVDGQVLRLDVVDVVAK